MKKNKLDELFEKGKKMHHLTNTAYPLRPTSLLRYKITGNDLIKKTLEEDLEHIDELSLYVHVPFCQSRCKFCEYAVVSGDDFNKKEEYVNALLKEIDMYKTLIGDKKIVGYDMGGGTPTILETEQIRKVTNYIFKNFNFSDNCTASIETTPIIAARDFEKIAALKEMGYERISMGIQTINPKLLELFGREGSTSIYKQATDNIRKSGFKRFNVDVMYGFLNQDLEDFKATIKYAISLNPEYITLYRNRYKGTKIASEAEHVTLEKVIYSIKKLGVS